MSPLLRWLLRSGTGLCLHRYDVDNMFPDLQGRRDKLCHEHLRPTNIMGDDNNVYKD